MSKLYVQLGRAGDIMNILPLLWKDSQSGENPRLMVASEYAPLLDGVSYVDKVVYEGPHYELDKAVALAKTMATGVVVTQTNGPAEVVKEATYAAAGQTGAQATSFQKESWRVAGRLKEWDELYPLVFDLRDAVREDQLLQEDYIRRGRKKPLLLLSLKGTSSPFPYSDLLRELVTAKFGLKYRVMELPQAERIYDLLALYERASLLIAVDSAPLHLAWAFRKLPVFALTQDRPMLWHGAAWRPNHLWYCRYHDWPDRAVEMCAAITSLDHPYSTDHFVTVWNSYGNTEHYAARQQVLPVKTGMCGRDSGNTLQDPKHAPYLRDVLRMAMQRSETDDTQINLTRPKVSIPSKSPSQFIPSFAYRMTRTADGDQFAPIADMFCATKKWWKGLLPEIPDMILGNDYYWSECLRVLFQKHGAKDATGLCSFVKEEKNG